MPPAPDALSGLENHFPGREVELDVGGGRTLTVRVLPVGIRQVRQFSRSLVTAARAVLGTEVGEEIMKVSDGDKAKLIGGLMLEASLGDLFDLFEQCVTPDVGALPHWLLPPVLEAWIEENFLGEGRLRPWAEALDTAVKRATGEDLRMSERLSEFLSGTGGTPTPSSTEEGGTGGEEDSRTEGGPSDNSGPPTA